MNNNDATQAKQINVRVYFGYSVMLAELRLPVGLDSYEENQLHQHFVNVYHRGPFELSALIPLPGSGDAAQIFYLPCTHITNPEGFSEFVTKVVLQDFHTNANPILIPMSLEEEIGLSQFLHSL